MQQNIFPLFNTQGCEMLTQVLGEDVRSKINDFVHSGATKCQHMYTSRASLASSKPNSTFYLAMPRNELFHEVFTVLKRAEFLLGSCSWPAIEFYCGPNATEEAFSSLLRNLENHCVQMMRYSLTLPRATDASFEEISKSEDFNEDSWSRACECNRQMLLRSVSSIKYDDVFHYLTSVVTGVWGASIAVISKDSAMYSEDPAALEIPSKCIRWSDKILLDEGPPMV